MNRMVAAAVRQKIRQHTVALNRNVIALIGKMVDGVYDLTVHRGIHFKNIVIINIRRFGMRASPRGYVTAKIAHVLQSRRSQNRKRLALDVAVIISRMEDRNIGVFLANRV